MPDSEQPPIDSLAQEELLLQIINNKLEDNNGPQLAEQTGRDHNGTYGTLRSLENAGLIVRDSLLIGSLGRPSALSSVDPEQIPVLIEYFEAKGRRIRTAIRRLHRQAEAE